MQTPTLSEYFLGANSIFGFRSLFSELQDGHTKLHIIKGGPGCGKSTYMKTIAESLEKEGYAVERICCSSDPESLDGFRVRELDLAYADGTSPHVVEPLYAGACEVFVDLLKHCDIDGLRSVRDDIKSVSADIKKHFVLASCYISSAGTVCNAIRRRGSADHDKLERRTKRLCVSLIPRQLRIISEGRRDKVFLSAFTPFGTVCKYEAAVKLCPTVYEISDSFGLADNVLRQLSAFAVSHGYDVIECYSALFPDEIEHLLIPDLALSFLQSNLIFSFEGKAEKNIKLDNFVSKPHRSEYASLYRRDRKLVNEHINNAVSELKSAKLLHDELEKLYNPYVDFNAIRESAKKALDK